MPILFVLFVVSLVFTGYNHYGPFELKKELPEVELERIPKYFDYGVVSDSTYCNDFFKFRVPIPKGQEAEYKLYDYIEKSIFEKDSVLAKPRLVSDIAEHDLVIIKKELVKVELSKVLKETGSSDSYWKYSAEKRKTEFYGPDYNLIIRAYNLHGKPFGTFASQFSNIHNPDYSGAQTKMISGIEFREYSGATESNLAYRLIGGEDKKIISFMTEINGFAFSINIFYKTEEQKCLLLEIVDEIKFYWSIKITLVKLPLFLIVIVPNRLKIG